jgi:hypothetical protein
MPFEIKYENLNGSFQVKLARNVSCEEAMQLTQLATNIIRDSESQGVVYGPHLPPNGPNEFISPLQKNVGNGLGVNQTKLGERPVDSIKLGDYVEPENGVRLKILSFPPTGRMRAVASLRELTRITIMGCKEIIFGNHPCPILSEEVASKMMEILKDLEIHAKVVPADNDVAA